MSPTIVLVHGGFVDGAGWRGVYDVLTADGFDVRIVQNPTKSLADDVAVTRGVLNDIPGPVVLVGHSYGGAVITEAGNHDKVEALVYVTAFAPDQGESVDTLLGGFPADGPQPPILPPVDGSLFLDRGRFAEAFAADVSAQDAAFMADSQVPWGLDALGGTVTKAAWQTKPSWYLHVTEDRMIPPAAQTAMARRIGATVAETPGSHAIYVSRPEVVADLIKKAANG
ncbi:alpha/beta fold hydrolase [Streptomyces sp. NPDC090025]|uniref:alpha/beta fold hydrolase n=1 Tax=Streptomyces sp. NPDC090025 TaxID=3365922 RepID=UPI0038355438